MTLRQAAARGAMRVAKWLAGRSYAAARPSNIAGGFAFNVQQSANDLIRWELKGLVAHARQQAQNNDYLKAYFAMVRRHIIGPQGIRLQAVARDPNGSLDKAANTLLQDGFTAWGKKGSPTVDGQHSWLSLQNLAAETVARDGNVLVRLYRGPKFGPWGFQVQPLEIDHLDTELNIDQNDGTRVVMGVEFTSNGKPAAYHLFRQHPGDSVGRMRRDRLRVPAADVVLLFRAERPGQVVGVPWSYTALRRLNMLHGYEEAAITAARAGAAKMGFYQTPVGEDGVTTEWLDKQEKTATGHLLRNFEPGMIETLPPGMEYKEHSPAYPDGEIGPFMKTVLRGAAAGLGVSYSTLANDLEGANFSSLRAGQVEEHDEWRTLQNWMAESLHDRIYMAWVEMALLTGAVKLPFAKVEKFQAARWRPRGWAYVNPSDEATANQRLMAALLKAPQDIVAEYGGDLDETFENIAEAKALADSYGLNFNPLPPGQDGQQPAAAPAIP